MSDICKSIFLYCTECGTRKETCTYDENIKSGTTVRGVCIDCNDPERAYRKHIYHISRHSNRDPYADEDQANRMPTTGF